MQKSECYKLLGLEPGASRTEIRKRYRHLALRYHPDRNPNPHAGELFIKLTEAYEILLGNREAAPPSSSAREERKAATKEERMRTAHERRTDQAIREKQENERYFNYLTKGPKWKTIRLSAAVGILLSALLILDFFLPHHFEQDEITKYSSNVGLSPEGVEVGLVSTARENYYFVGQMHYSLYSRHRYILVESTWIFHNPLRIISLGKTERPAYSIHFTLFGFVWLVIPAFLLPAMTVRFKRRSVAYTVLYHVSYFGTGIGIILFLITGARWAHLLTLGFL